MSFVILFHLSEINHSFWRLNSSSKVPFLPFRDLVYQLYVNDIWYSVILYCKDILFRKYNTLQKKKNSSYRYIFHKHVYFLWIFPSEDVYIWVHVRISRSIVPQCFIYFLKFICFKWDASNKLFHIAFNVYEGKNKQAQTNEKTYY